MSEGEPGGLTQEVYERIHALSQIEKDLGKNSKSPQLSNVKAVLKAYRDGSLEWYSDLVTYWSKGTKLCEPRPFDWDEFEALNAIHGQSKSFWTEGVCINRSYICLF